MLLKRVSIEITKQIKQYLVHFHSCNVDNQTILRAVVQVQFLNIFVNKFLVRLSMMYRVIYRRYLMFENFIFLRRIVIFFSSVFLFLNKNYNNVSLG